MGLLDALFQSGGSGGLLDFLRNNAQNQDMSSSGLQSAQAQYGQSAMPLPIFQQPSQPSPLDNAQWPSGPNGAPSQANAQMQPAVPQQQPIVPQQSAPQESPNPLGAGFNGFIRNLHNGPIGAIVGGLGGAMGMQDQATKFANQTEQYLVTKKGIDPALAKTIVADPVLLRAVLKPKDAPEGFETNPGGGLKPIAGGPADPAYLRLKDQKAIDPNAVHVLGRDGELYRVDEQGNIKIVHKNENSGDATLDDSTTSAMAAQYLAGDRSVMQNLGRGAQGAANIVKLRTAIYQQAEADGKNAKDIVTTFNEQAGNLAGQRAVGTRAANISLAANEASNMIPIALEASDKLPRSQYMPWNQMVQSVQKGTSSPELASFVAATNSLVNSYVRAVSPSGVPTDSMREHAYSMLNAAQGPEAYKAVVVTMQKEMKAALQAPSQVREELRSGHSEAPRESQGKSGDEIYAQARDAIARGAPREKVLERLRQNGVDPSGL